MEYGRLGPTDLSRADETPVNRPRSSTTANTKIILFSLLAIVLIVASAISAVLVTVVRSRASTDDGRLKEPTLAGKPTQAISRTCSRTRFPDLCVNSLLDFPGSTAATERDLVHISFNMTLQHFSKALYISAAISSSGVYASMDPRSRAAYDDCLELLDESVDAIARSLTTVSPSGASPGGTVRPLGSSSDDVLTWLSAALTNQETCAEGMEGASGAVKSQMANNLKDLSELVSNCLAIFSASGAGDDFSGVPIQNRRRLMAMRKEEVEEKEDFPKWLSKRDRRLLSLPVSAVQADVIVSKDGNGSVKTIAEAIKKVPEYGNRRFVIYIKAGRYEEDNLKVGRKKTNVMIIGDGKGKTVITGGRNVLQEMTTFHTASFAASGSGFIARDMTFENYAGPAKHQAVALRLSSDHAVVYRCNVIGYQDTCYVHSNRQFFRECDIYGTVDFIFGNAAVVFQNCSLYARKPMPQQKNTITAQNRKDPNQNTGISIHNCRILATSDLQASKGSFPTYLGRPWKMYARTVYMISYIGDHVHPRGWLEWNTSNFALDTCYYGEYMNFGPGAAIGQRVKWAGYRIITSTVEASRFTVGQFISGSSWLPSTGVAFISGLST
ncbi:probable pectinesterase/pectinesterase inhibitor 61 [Arachis stenosperma]|uniref:probable pectinesterase/pectinesterase inhibitor 61 n=1 Tax=Arachis stenosperma TaxID=217475 RepID=UPI0025AB857C|nr:probable pectinesterase/pectinesterase inhibitor 61 [Arachis stenosperma]